jgi:hypothetical protein|tara:strand:- start:345 stop:554 length:210 start_codon:yes stop_codon:yes gene_type:complete
MGDLVNFPSMKFVRFYKDFIECDFCGQHTKGRVYEDSQEIVCGSCNSVLFEFKDEEDDFMIVFRPDEDV